MKKLLNGIGSKTAIDYLQKKGNKATSKYSKQVSEDWNDSVKARSFFSSRVAKVEVLEALRHRTLQVVEGRLSKNEARAWIKEFLKTDGANALAECGFMPVNEKESLAELGSTRRINLIIEENVRQAHAIGQYASLSHEYSIYPYLKYKTRGDLNVRSSHALLHNKVYAVDDSIWSQIYPPNDFGCRCFVIGLTSKDAKNFKISKGLPEGIDADNPLSRSGYSFDVTQGLATAMQEKELWSDALKMKYRASVAPFMKSQAYFLSKRRSFWLDEAAKANDSEYADFCKVVVKGIEKQINYCVNYSKNIPVSKGVKEIMKGTIAENTVEDAKMYLLLNPVVKSALGYKTRWHRDILDVDNQKYLDGKGRKDNEADLKRLTHIGRAVEAIKRPDIVYRGVTPSGLVQHIHVKKVAGNRNAIAFVGIHKDGKYPRSFYVLSDRRLQRKINKEHWTKLSLDT